MPKKVRWGVLGAASIAIRKVIPAMQKCGRCEIAAIASRELGKAQDAARSLGIPTAYGSYEELLADSQIDAVYNPLPNHLHVPWTIKAAEAGKHVLCEKPISMNVAEAKTLIPVRDRMRVKIGEAFMSFAHPQWLRARELVLTGRVGTLRSILGAFSYFKLDTENIRNILEYGGGALYDIGCYPIAMSRFMFGSEPSRVVSLVERDPEMKIDRLTSALLEFPEGHALFTCGTQLVPYQRMQFLGTTGRIEIEIPFNAPPDRPCRIFVDDGRDIFGSGISIETIPTSDQYTIQAELFSKAIQEDGEVPVSVEDAIRNMAVIDAVFRSAETRQWERPQA